MSAPADRSPTAGPFDLTPPTPDQRAVLVERLSDEERHVLLSHGTEAPFCGGLLDNKNPGTYACRLCGLPLFRSGTKFDPAPAGPASPRPTRTRI